MVGEGCDEAGVHHPERISHALRHFSFFPFSFICCQHRPCNHHLYNQQPCSYHPCNQQPCNHYLCKHNFMIIPLGIIVLASILLTIITFKAFMASSSVRSSPAKMILIRSLQATPNADRKMWIAALPCIVRLLMIVIIIVYCPA